jgi:hypothetical protein
MLGRRMRLHYCRLLDPWAGDEIAAGVSPLLLQY